MALLRFRISVILMLFFGALATNEGFAQSINRGQRFVKNQLVVMYTGKLSEEQKQRVRDTIQMEGKVRKFKVVQCACDEDLEMWVGENVESLLSDSAEVSGQARPVSRGQVSEDSIYLSRNYEFPTPASQSTRMKVMPDVVSANKNEVRIAVLDTGLDPKCFTDNAKNNFLLRNAELPFSCTVGNPESFAGWNFVAGNSNYHDDHRPKHGTNITGLILTEGTNNRLRILPLKTHNGSGVATMFNLLCGMKYARKAGVHYLNASWGDYGMENLLFSRVLNELSSANIGFIAAAGNEGRDIGTNTFYPASYSNTEPFRYPNVITVTTVTPNGQCTHNFSGRHVDIGASGRTGSCFFISPFQPAGSTALQISGSSFATAVMTGKIANHHPYRTGGPLKQKVLESTELSPAATGVVDTRTGKAYKQQ